MFQTLILRETTSAEVDTLVDFVTDEQRSRRPIFDATLRTAASRLFFRPRPPDRLEKQPTDLRRHYHYMRDGALGSQYRGSEILLDVLRSQGTQFIFGNPGTTELPLIDALVTNRDIKYVWGLQEATAVSMADGYAQASGKPAFVNLHTSGGLGHGRGCE